MNNTRKINRVVRKIEPTSYDIGEARIDMCMAKCAILEDSVEITNSIKGESIYRLTEVLYQEIEKKNNAYIFILESGNMEAFESYCNNDSVKVSQDKPILRIV